VSKVSKVLSLLVLLSGLGVGCGSSGSSSVSLAPGSGIPSLPTPDLTPGQEIYVALGASDAVGFNASVSCDGPANGEGRPPRQSDPLDCPGGTGYVPQLAQTLAVDQLLNLGISGAVVGPQIRSLPILTGPRPPADILTDQVPRIPNTATLITLWTGNNDTIQLALATASAVLQGQDPGGFIAGQVELFGSEFEAVLADIRQQAPNSRLVVGNIPNFALTPVGQTQLNSVRILLQEISIAINQQVFNPLSTQGIPVADIGCDPRSYQDSSFFPGPLADGFHPNDVGYGALAEVFLTAIQAPMAPALCSFQDPGRRLPGSLADLDLAELEAFVSSQP
jgi:lysophospholipase L1-like esterase